MDLRRIQGGEISGLQLEEMDFLGTCMNLNENAVWNQWTALPAGEGEVDLDLGKFI
jgi:hypothetical protein